MEIGRRPRSTVHTGAAPVLSMASLLLTTVRRCRFRKQKSVIFRAAPCCRCSAYDCVQRLPCSDRDRLGRTLGQQYALTVKQGIEMALAEINERGGIGGSKVEWLSRNDSASGARAAEVATEFLENRRVVAVVGHVNSGAMVAAARVYDGGLPAVAVTATSPDLTGISPWVFRVMPSDSVNGIHLAEFAQRMAFKRTAVLYENDAFGRNLADAFRRAYRGELVSFDPIPSDSTTDFEPYIAYIKSRLPDAVLMVMSKRRDSSCCASQTQHLEAAALWIGWLDGARAVPE